MSKVNETKKLLNLQRQVVERDQIILELMIANRILRSSEDKTPQIARIRRLLQDEQKIYPEARLPEILKAVGIPMSKWESTKGKS